MTFPEWTKPGIYGVVGGALAVSILGFTWGGWVTSSDAQSMAQKLAKNEVTLAMVPVCLGLSEADPEREEKLEILQDLTGFGRRNAMLETGWATRPGSDKPDRDLADACLAELKIDGS